MPSTRLPGPVPPTTLLHQEGVVGLLALIGLAFRAGGPIPALAHRDALLVSLLVGVAAGSGIVLLLWSVRRIPPVARLEAWQRDLVQGWSRRDAAAVAILSGLAEEALLRAFLQPLVGIVIAAAVFALLHVVPQRELWMWPTLAFGMGLLLGLLFERWGYPAAAAAHVMINAVALARLRRHRCVQ